MQPISILLPDDPSRVLAEDLVHKIFRERYNARLSRFPERLAVQFDVQGNPLCVAGLRFASDGFFSEYYLRGPVEETLSATFGFPISRADIFEVTSLTSLDHRLTPGFIRNIIRYGQMAGYEWSFFTLTHRLHTLLSRIGIHPTFLADALRDAVPNPADWGSYYDEAPAVFALANPDRFSPNVAPTGLAHAVSL
ncbi:thermostable hemolysin [Allorhizobium sp. BGMRC 0089]|uniref:thermostable hemolysin n=1 Tax=Allorhizobium sonneratiae TaxID=2934936 RepID=UPI002033E50F|nr:thermostable hemolysin [Allorhizobium sonneratiae]MCM2293794.1 thermostable hemolysin [Allorhizobium sonneratiae]